MSSSEHTANDSSARTGWYKSSYSGGDQGECLEVACGHAVVPVRDSKDTAKPALIFSAAGWTSFVSAVKDGRIGDA
ncbi:DUF397 domain-containing protein [Streptomyces sp. NBC_00557]|uniref:DUF397 domain-containing protein n=1 Tax=Streptomyces sp. NBC_00557 TaxID=2975776 RepID=UPI002E821BE4|nr:DUF397 domain-containing protein [Streptomyces sp. NBC_00557]WUC36846.1 DUF397 domain-containing protein [Streptomyces sp. NBC_00557]